MKRDEARERPPVWDQEPTQESDKGWAEPYCRARPGWEASALRPAPPSVAPAPGGPERRETSPRQVLLALRVAHPDGRYSAKRTIDPLLEVWAVVSAVDRSAARPIEVMLQGLVHRPLVTASKLWACADDVEAVLDTL
jgi:hypothetical protein